MKIIPRMVGLMFFTTISFAADPAPKYQICNQPYALCTTAPCKPVPGSKTQSVCSCIVQDGPSLGAVSCDKRKPTKSSDGQQLLTSNFSFQNSATNRVMTCNGKYPWTDCLDKPCIIDPQNSNQAICMCDIKYSASFITFGGQCDTASCGTTLYSGATEAMLESGMGQLMTALHIKTTPMKNCTLRD